MNTTIASITARALLGRRRFLLLLPLPLLLVGLTALAHGLHPDPSKWGEPVVAGLGFAVVLPMIALVLGTGVLGAEIDDGTIVHVLATPVSRRDIVLAKLAVAAGITTAVGAVAMFVTGAIVESVRFGLGLAVACAVASIAYSALFLALSLVTRRPVLLGLLYVLIWEGLLGNIVGGARILSIAHYSLGVANAIYPDKDLNAGLGLSTSLVLGIVVTVGALVLASRRLSSFAIKGEPA